MNNHISDISEYVENGLIRLTSDDEYTIACYSKSCFFGKDTWDEKTKTHRGQLYFKNYKVNKPFDKIFNVGEVPETEEELIYNRMKTEPFDIYDKANGHLFIVSMFYDEFFNRRVVYSTKGSLPNENNDLLNDDIKLFELLVPNINFMFPEYENVTLMFEAIVEHDQHSMYDNQVELYGDENTFVLLGVNTRLEENEEWVDESYKILTRFSNDLNLPIVKKHTHIPGKPSTWKEHKDTEGYVIKFINGDRVKIKTTEYWQNRFKKDLSPSKILNVFKKGGKDRIFLKLPEEVAQNVYDVIICGYWGWLDEKYLREPKLYMMNRVEPLNEFDIIWVFKESNFNNIQKSWIMCENNHTKMNIEDSRELKKEFVFDMLKTKKIDDLLREVVYNAI